MERLQDEAKHPCQDDVREKRRFEGKTQRHEAYVYPVFERTRSKVTWRGFRTKQNIHAKMISKKRAVLKAKRRGTRLTSTHSWKGPTAK